MKDYFTKSLPLNFKFMLKLLFSSKLRKMRKNIKTDIHYTKIRENMNRPDVSYNDYLRSNF